MYAGRGVVWGGLRVERESEGQMRVLECTGENGVGGEGCRDSRESNTHIQTRR